MKKILKSRIFTFILGALIFGSITGVVAYNYNAKDMGYTPSDATWNVNNVNDALNNLKANIPNLSNSTVTSANDIISGKKAYGSDGTLFTGTHDDCISGIHTFTSSSSTSNGEVWLSFIPSKFLYFYEGDGGLATLYWQELSSSFYELRQNSKWGEVSRTYIDFINGKTVFKNLDSSTNGKKVYYIACK